MIVSQLVIEAKWPQHKFNRSSLRIAEAKEAAINLYPVISQIAPTKSM